MARILFFVFLAFLVWLVVRLLGSSRRREDIARATTPVPQPATSDRVVETVRQCAWCGVHVPARDALTLPDGRIYCGDAHRDAALRVTAPEDRTT